MEPQGSNKSGTKPIVNDRLLGIFARDAINTIETVSSVLALSNNLSEDDIRKYTISVHGIKSALAYIGQTDLSAEALNLEMAGRSNDIEKLISRTPDFLLALQQLVDDIKLKQQSNENNADEDRVFLTEQLEVIKNAAEEFDENIISNVISLIREKKWSSATGKLIDDIAGCLLHSDFDRIVELITTKK